MHPEAFAYVQQAVAGRTFPRVLEFGSRDINGSVRPLFPGADYLGIDTEPGVGVDQVADASTWKRGGFDAVVCCEVLEHTAKAAAIVAAARRALPAGGIFVATCATVGRDPHSAVYGGPLPSGEYYRNVSRRSLSAWLRRGDFTSWDLTVRGNDLYATAIA